MKRILAEPFHVFNRPVSRCDSMSDVAVATMSLAITMTADEAETNLD